MELFLNNTNFFDGLSTFPKDPEELRTHISRLNYTLQKRYFISPEAAELALQTQNEEEFNRFYRQQVMRIVGQFNTTARRQLKVRVDPRLPKGMQIIREGVIPPKEVKTVKHTSEWRMVVASPPSRKNAVDISQPKSTTEGMDKHSRYNPQSSLLEGHRTPQASSSSLAAIMHGGMPTTDGKVTVSSDDCSTVLQSSTKKSCREVLFGTPPEFKGFTVPLENSPADSLTSKSPLLF
ncbi:putative chromosomal passenger protein [Trypanosoma theileri]|uniref:Putative chromosomal passenger protein n=1 Tax=Trypanosoma theileri TaxID=67003 RepID=A0A1X0NUE6_9TRYP|nr:putative chromosomal passenger protein [Trypanosoma theileri]ORC88315.1 putative chromosomal passenger protein [Trypanosoma theileri]